MEEHSKVILKMKKSLQISSKLKWRRMGDNGSGCILTGISIALSENMGNQTLEGYSLSYN